MINYKFYRILLALIIISISADKTFSQISYDELYEIEQFGTKSLIRADSFIYCIDQLQEVEWVISNSIFTGEGKRLGGGFNDTMFIYLIPNTEKSFKIYGLDGNLIESTFHYVGGIPSQNVLAVYNDFILYEEEGGNIQADWLRLTRQEYKREAVGPEEFQGEFYRKQNIEYDCYDWIYRDSITNRITFQNNHVIVHDTVSVFDTGTGPLNKEICQVANLSGCLLLQQCEMLDTINSVTSIHDELVVFYPSGIHKNSIKVSDENCEYGVNINDYSVGITNNGEILVLDSMFNVAQRDIFHNNAFTNITGLKNDEFLLVFFLKTKIIF